MKRYIHNIELRIYRGGSILDLYPTDEDSKKYNIEIQRSDKGAHAKQARYNNTLINVKIIEPENNYQNLAETYVIFITEKDMKGRIF